MAVIQVEGYVGFGKVAEGCKHELIILEEHDNPTQSLNLLCRHCDYRIMLKVVFP